MPAFVATPVRVVVESRLLIALGAAAVVGALGLRQFPINTDEPFLAAIADQRPDVLAAIGYG